MVTPGTKFQKLYQLLVCSALLGMVHGQELTSAIGPEAPVMAQELPPLERFPSEARAQRLGALSEEERRGMPAEARGRVRRLSGVRRGQVSSRAMEDGRTLLQFTVSSAGAAAVRLHFEGFDLGEGKVWVYPAGASREYLAENPSAADGPLTGRGPHGDGEFWSKPIEGDTATVEVLLAANPAELPFRVDELVHTVPERESTLACQRDVNCSPEFASVATAVGSYDIVKDGYGFVCSGALVVTRSRSFQPYFMTANHCVSTQAHARSVVVYWDFRSATCNGTVPSRASRPSTRGARLLATAGMGGGDYALLLLDQAAPGQRTFLGWSATDLALGASTVGIHHPASPPTNFQRITFGTRVADRTSVVGGETAPAALYWQINETEGRTEQGSSGSPLMTRDGQLVGVLSHGPVPGPGQTYCDIQGRGSYGRFSAALPAVTQFLNDEAAPGLSVSATSFAFTAADGVVAPGPQRLEIRNSAATAASYTVTKSVPWITLSATSGSATSATAGTVTISVNPALLGAPGVFDGIVTVASGSLAPLNVSVRATVTFNQSAAVVTVDPNPVYETTPDADGYTMFYSLRVDETAGVPARITRLVIDGTDRSADIVAFFDTAELPAFGGVGASLRLRLTNLPRRRRIEVSGITVANGRPWSASVDADFLPRPVNAQLTMTVAPGDVAQNDSAANCRWRHELIVQETAGYGVTLNRWTAGELDLSSRIGEFFGSTTLPGNGLVGTTLCWAQVGAVPRALVFTMSGVDEKGAAVTITGQARMVGVTTSSSTLATSVAEFKERAEAGGEALLRRTFQVNTAADALWSITPVISGAAKDWISVNPQRGRGPATVTVTLDAYYLTAGVYKGALIVQSSATSPQFSTVDVEFEAFRALAGPPRVTGAVNGASFRAGAVSPGSWITVFGENLASTAAPGRTWTGAEIIGTRLPVTLDGSTVRIGGLAAAMYFVGPGQLNVQVPDVPADGPATLEVDVSGTKVQSTVTIARVAPALFQIGTIGANALPAAIDARGALIGDPAAIPSARRAVTGEIVALYGTGFGPTQPNAAAGTIPSGAPPLTNAVTVTVGGVRAEVLYAGLTGAGLNQINIRVPALARGNHAIAITVGGASIQPNLVLAVN